MEQEDKDLEAYQLASSILDKLNIHSGIMTKYPQYYAQQKSKKGYISNMRLLEYDMLYGNRYILNRENPFKITDIQLGTYPMTISNVKKEDDGTVTVTGGDFTSYTAIHINGKRVETEFVSEDTVTCKYDLQYGDEVQIVQESKKHKKLSESEIYYY